MKIPGHKLLLFSLVFICTSCFDPSFSSWGTCFLAGTLIETPDGEVPIETLKPGDTVISWDEQSHTLVSGKVINLYQRQVDNYLSFVLANGRNLQVTQDHPLGILPEDGVSLQWSLAAVVAPGDHLAGLPGGAELIPTDIVSLQKKNGSTTVYNIKVERYKNSFAEGVLTHFYFQPGDPVYTQRQKPSKDF